MKVTIYIEKNDFDEFFKWMNRIKLGLFSTPKVNFSHRHEVIADPLRITLDEREYTLIKDVEKDIKDIQSAYGPIEIDFSPESTVNHLLVIRDVLRESERNDVAAEVVFTAIQAAQQVPGISPTEAMVIAEREWLDHKNY
jgi:hypothetical protein